MSQRSTDKLEERRAEPRHAFHRHCVVRFDRQHLDGHPGSAATQGYLSDLSACGVGLLLQPAIPAGATLAITPSEPGAPPMPLARVVHCVPVGGRWRHGCSLERRLSEEELRGWLA